MTDYIEELFEKLKKENEKLKEFKHMIELERSINSVCKFECQCWWCKLKRRLA
jgi:hypothetical protein